MLVALKFFVDSEKTIDWIGPIERGLRYCSSVRGLEIALVLIIVLTISRILPNNYSAQFVTSAIMGLLVFVAVDGLGTVLDNVAGRTAEIGAKGGLGAFLYLEVLDASFSFDGVIGAFALTANILLIAIGLGIGAMYVRAMTIMLVEKGTLAEFRYLEHGAFYSIFALSLVMFMQSIFHVHELITGGVGMTIIALSFVSSIRHNQKD